MNLQTEILRLKQLQSERNREYEKIQKELEEILFSEDFSYETIEISKSKSYVYPCVVPSKQFQIYDEKIETDDMQMLKRSYTLLDKNQKNSIQVTELSFLDTVEKPFILKDIHGTIKSTIVKWVNYTVVLCGVDFSFSKNISEKMLLTNNHENFKMKQFSNAISSITMKNGQLEDIFSVSLKPFLYDNKEAFSLKEAIENSITKISFSQWVYGKFSFTKQEHERKFSFSLKCNETVVSFTKKFQVIKYLVRVFLKTMENDKKVSEFSGDGYCIPCFLKDDDEIIEINQLLS